MSDPLDGYLQTHRSMGRLSRIAFALLMVASLIFLVACMKVGDVVFYVRGLVRRALGRK